MQLSNHIYCPHLLIADVIDELGAPLAGLWIGNGFDCDFNALAQKKRPKTGR